VRTAPLQLVYGKQTLTTPLAVHPSEKASKAKVPEKDSKLVEVTSAGDAKDRGLSGGEEWFRFSQVFAAEELTTLSLRTDEANAFAVDKRQGRLVYLWFVSPQPGFFLGRFTLQVHFPTEFSVGPFSVKAVCLQPLRQSRALLAPPLNDQRHSETSSSRASFSDPKAKGVCEEPDLNEPRAPSENNENINFLMPAFPGAMAKSTANSQVDAPANLTDPSRESALGPKRSDVLSASATQLAMQTEQEDALFTSPQRCDVSRHINTFSV
jgi:hypothetical protein